MIPVGTKVKIVGKKVGCSKPCYDCIGKKGKQVLIITGYADSPRDNGAETHVKYENGNDNCTVGHCDLQPVSWKEMMDYDT